MAKKIKNNTKKCDICGQFFSGKSFPVYDENYNKQQGLIQCEKCSNQK